MTRKKALEVFPERKALEVSRKKAPGCHPILLRVSTSGKKMGYKCISFPMLDNIISIYGIKTG